MPKGRDTPETIMAVAQRYVDGEPRAAWATADKLMTSLARERAFAGGVLEAAEASDQNGLRRLFARKPRLMRTTSQSRTLIPMSMYVPS